MTSDPWEGPPDDREAPSPAPPPLDPYLASDPPRFRPAHWEYRAPSLDFGRVLGTGFATWARNLVPFTLLGVIVYLPMFAFLLLTYRQTTDPGGRADPGLVVALWVVTLLLQIVLSFVLTGAIVYGVFERLRGRRPGLGAILSTGFARLLPVLGVSILMGLAMLACFLPGALAIGLGLAASHGSPVAVILGVLLLLAGVVPFCFLLSIWYVAVPAAVMERVGAVGSLKRSQELTRGSRWLIFALLVIIYLLGVIVSGIVQVSILAAVAHTPRSLLIVELLGQLASVVVGLLGNMMTTVAYCELRGIKEGVTPDDLGEIFA
jgi:hypothetical protein